MYAAAQDDLLAVTPASKGRERIASDSDVALRPKFEAAQQTVDSLRQSGLAIDDLNKVAIGFRSGSSRFTLQAA